jgi:hypothetical protein
MVEKIAAMEDEILDWIKSYRKMLKWEWADDPYMFALWSRLLLEANYEPEKWHGKVIERGQLVTSLSSLSARSGIPVQSLRTCLQRLVDSEQITKESTNKYTIITICNYDRYQAKSTICQQTTNNQITNEQQTSNIQPTIGQQTTNNTTRNKEVKELKEEKKDIPPLSPKGEKPKFDLEKIFEGYGAEWIELFKQWLDYKREKKNTYKGEKSMRTMAKKLFEMAGGDIVTARAIVEQSMANNWQGLFELKTDGGAGGKTGRYKGDSTIGTNFIYRP